MSIKSNGASEEDIDSIEWNLLPVPSCELDLQTVVTCGQSFRWKRRGTSNEWIGIFQGKLWLLKQDRNAGNLFYKVLEKPGAYKSDRKELEALLRDYFQLDISLQSLYKEWAERDPDFSFLTSNNDQLQAIRIMKQDPFETILAFICSSNNFIGRITSMVEKLASNYGEEIGKIDNQIHYDFPTVENLVKGQDVEKNLRDMKFGYRAAYIVKTAEAILAKGGEYWAVNLRTVGYEAARKELIALPGVGPKVADCICLMALGYHTAVPVDTHILQVAKEKLPHLKKVKTISENNYSEITKYFRSVYGDFAGWAQSILFSSKLTHLKNGSNGETEPEKKKTKRS